MQYDLSKLNGWGNSMFFTNFEKRLISGHLTPLPKIGDTVISKMESGRTAEFKIISIEGMSDPRDQFFGQVEDIGYLRDQGE